MTTETISISMTLHLHDDPTIPDAKRGHVASGAGRPPQTTDEQSAAGLIWWQCTFCHSWVLVDAYRQTREKCTCGARRCHHTSRPDSWGEKYYSEGWTRDGQTWWFC